MRQSGNNCKSDMKHIKNIKSNKMLRVMHEMATEESRPKCGPRD